MKGFFKRFLWYLLGVGLGSIMVMVLFGDRDIQCAYFPNDRVLYDFRKKRLVIDQEQMQQLASMQLDTAAVRQMLWHGTVDFEASKTQIDSCKEYTIHHEQWSARWQNCTHELRLLEVMH